MIVLGDGPVPERAQKFTDFTRHAGPAHKLRLPGLSAELDPDDAINIQFTSGTTGSPKGATLSHFNIVNNARYCADAMALNPQDRLCIPVPLYHCFGMVIGVLVCVASGATMVFPGESFDAAQTIAAVSRYRCTALHGVPTMFIAMLAHPSLPQHDVSSLRTGIMAGAPCPIETMRQVVSQLHMSQVTIAYGMTETSPISFQSGVDDPLERRVSTVGRIHPHVEVKIVDGDGRIVPVGQSGELCTRGYCVMRGYWEDEPRTREAIDESGWMHTGDLATLDDIAQGFGLDIIAAHAITDREAVGAALAGAPNIGVVLSVAAAREDAFVALLQVLAGRLKTAQLILIEPDALRAFAFLPALWPTMSIEEARARAAAILQNRAPAAEAETPPAPEPEPKPEPEPSPSP